MLRTVSLSSVKGFGQLVSFRLFVIAKFSTSSYLFSTYRVMWLRLLIIEYFLQYGYIIRNDSEILKIIAFLVDVCEKV